MRTHIGLSQLSFRQIPDSSYLVLRTSKSNFGISLPKPWSRLLLTTRCPSTAWSSTQMAPASPRALWIKPLKSGTSVAKDLSSTMMLPTKVWQLLPSTQMEDTCCLHRLTLPSKSGIFVRVTSFTPFMDMKAQLTQSDFRQAEITSLLLELTRSWCAGNQIWTNLIPKTLMMLPPKLLISRLRPKMSCHRMHQLSSKGQVQLVMLQVLPPK